MNLGLLKGILKNIEYSRINILNVLGSEDNKLNYENEKNLLKSLETLRAMGMTIHYVIDEESKYIDCKDE